MLEAVEQINEAQKRVLFKKLSASLGDVSGKKIALWGLAFKPNTDDMRNAPSLTFIEEVLKANGIVRAFDPIAMESARRILQGKKDFELCESRYDATQDADALVICTEWNEFRVIDFDILKERMRTRIIIDGRNIADAQKAREEGFTYLGIGR